jgi:hypothetical protein
MDKLNSRNFLRSSDVRKGFEEGGQMENDFVDECSDERHEDSTTVSEDAELLINLFKKDKQNAKSVPQEIPLPKRKPGPVKKKVAYGTVSEKSTFNYNKNISEEVEIFSEDFDVFIPKKKTKRPPPEINVLVYKIKKRFKGSKQMYTLNEDEVTH